jgi:uncharacterized repeat protein (TIGR01451 family)
VDDHHRGDTGSIAGGWSLTLTLLTPVNQTADIAVIGTSLPSPVLAGSSLTNVFVITNYGPNAAASVAFTNPLPATVAFVSATSSQGGIAQVGTNIIASLGSLSANSSATVTVVVVPSAAAAGLLTSTASAFATTGELDLNAANNTLSLPTTVVLPSSDLVVSQTATPDPVTVGSNLTYVLTVTNNGPQTALDLVLGNGFRCF